MFNRLSLILAALSLSACQTVSRETAVAAAPEAMRVYVIDCGYLGVDGSMNLDNFYSHPTYRFAKPNVVMSNPCFLVRHPRGDLMWDTGVPLDVPYPANSRNAVPPRLDEELAKIGLKPSDVEYLAFSHTHYDHTGQANLFAGATWLSDPAEYASMFSDAIKAAPSGGGVYPTFNQLEHARRIDITSDYDVFGDGSVVVLKTPGHSVGHQSLLLRLPKSGPVLISGDLFHSAEARDNNIFPARNFSAEDSRASIEKFNKLARDLNARVLIQHEMQHYQTLPHSPDFWE